MRFHVLEPGHVSRLSENLHMPNLSFLEGVSESTQAVKFQPSCTLESHPIKDFEFVGLGRGLESYREALI